MNAKQRAAEAALQFIQSDTTVGLGTGSTATLFIDALAREVKAGRLRNLNCVPTSVASEVQARRLGLHVVTLADVDRIEVTIDGADEIAPNLDLIKGLGGALLREKVVAQNSARLVIISDDSKRVPRLGTKAPVPVEVTPFGHEIQVPFLKSLGCTPALRKVPGGNVYVTDNGNYIYDCRFDGGIPDPAALDEKLARRAGVVESGLFLGMAEIALVADDARVERLTK
jgi:ribose 5-phosphate isomerase A